MSLHQLLIVHPVPSVRSLMTSMLRTMGHKIEEALGEQGAMAMLEQSQADLLLVSSDPTDGLDPIQLLSLVKRKYPKLPVLMFTSEPRPDRAREVMLRGATSVLRFPMPANQLRAVVSQALEDVVPVNREPDSENRAGSSASERTASLGNGHRSSARTYDKSADGRSLPRVSTEVLIGADPMLRLAVELADAIAPTKAPILIQGERGTGKSLLAKRLHGRSAQAHGPFLEVCCAGAKPPSLTVELFGQAGLNGAVERDGLVAQASGGTLVLSEVGELSPELQLRILELLKEGTFVPVDGDSRQISDCRIVVTNRDDLGPLVDEGVFRNDLFRAMSLVSLTLPPLRKRREDITALTEHFRELFAHEHDKPARGLTPEALHSLREHHWPGNVTELRDAVERAVLVSREKLILPSHLALSPIPHGTAAKAGAPRRNRSLSGTDRSILPLKEALEEPEKQFILEALQALNWNRQETARVLDINRTTLYKKMKKYGLIFDEPVWVN